MIRSASDTFMVCEMFNDDFMPRLLISHVVIE